MNTTKLIIAIIIGGLLGIGLAMLFAPPKIIEKPIEVVIKEPSNEWRKQDAYLDSLQTADSLRISYLNNRIKERDKRLERLKIIILKDSTKTTNEADSIIHSQDSTINDLGDEAELYSSQLYNANIQIKIRDNEILKRDSTIKIYKELVGLQLNTISDLEKKQKQNTFFNKIKDAGLIVGGTAMAILILIR